MKTVLVLDDNREILEAVAKRVEKHITGCRVLTAPDGAQGEAILRSEPVDLILTDLSMPVMNGYAVIEYAKEHYPSVPICVMTANCPPNVASRLLSMGVGRWIQKPFKFENLAKMIADELNIEYSD